MTVAARSMAARYERAAVLAGLCGVAVLAWVYLWAEAGRMAAMDDGAAMSMPGMAAGSPWEAGVFALTFVMWSVMMVGMMLPSALPAIMTYSAMARKGRAGGFVLPATWVFAGGYLAVWAAFSLGAASLHALLESARLLTPAMVSASNVLSGALLILAGVYQWLPAKDACLRKCRSPMQFFLFRWRSGMAGAFRMGLEHGLICLGCCWALMLLLFTAGVMSLLWVAVIAAFVFVEKLAPGGRAIGRATGMLLAVTGVGLLLSAI